MNIAAILSAKGHDVVTLNAGANVGDAVSVLREHNIGALIVVDDAGSVVGITSERDIVRKLDDQSTALLTQPISHCMTPKPYIAESNATIDEVMGRMTQYRIRHMPIVDDGKLVGIVSIGDIVKRKIQQAEAEREALKEYISS